MIERDPDDELSTETIVEVDQLTLASPHRPHCVGEHEHSIAVRKTVLQHPQEVGIHEWLAAGESDFLGPPSVPLNFIEIRCNFASDEIDEPVVARARFDVAVAAGDIAKRPSIEPKRLELS